MKQGRDSARQHFEPKNLKIHFNAISKPFVQERIMAYLAQHALPKQHGLSVRVA
jgi:hypothetical protein